MALLMLLMMKHMYTNQRRNRIVGIGSVVVFTLALSKPAQPDRDRGCQYMRGMIPHHSSAILTSTQAQIKDLRSVNWPMVSSAHSGRSSRR